MPNEFFDLIFTWIYNVYLKFKWDIKKTIHSYFYSIYIWNKGEGTVNMFLMRRLPINSVLVILVIKRDMKEKKYEILL